MTITAASGTGWTCTFTTRDLTCTRADVLAGGASYPPVTLIVGIEPTARGIVVNAATVDTDGDANAFNDGATDSTTVNSYPI